jgi:hypothetical protein
MKDELLHPAEFQVGESQFSFLLRLTELNHYATPAWITSLAGLPRISDPYPFIFDKSADLNRLATLSGRSVAELKARMYLPIGETVWTRSFFGLPVPYYMIRARRPRVCSLCLKDFGFCRAVWDLLPVTTCPIHRCLLLRNCPKCNCHISSSRTKLYLCKCTFDFRKAVPVPVEEHELRIAQQVHRLCGIPGSTNPVADFLPDNPLLSLDLFHLFSAGLLIAGQYEGFIDLVGLSWDSRRRDFDPHPSISKAVKVFDDWPNNYWQFLEWLRSQQRRSGYRSGLGKDFGQFYLTLYHRLPSTQFDFMRTAFNEYLCEKWDGGYLSAPIARTTGVVVDKRKYVPRSKAIRILEVDSNWVNRLIETGKLKVVTRDLDQNRKLVLIERESLNKLRDEFDDFLTMKQIAARLGVGLIAASDLIEHKCLQPARGPTIDGYPFWRFSKTALAEFEAQLKRRVVASRQAKTLIISFHHALSKAGQVGYSMGSFVRAILDGEISPCSPPSRRVLADLKFLRRQVSQLVRTRERIQNGDAVYATDLAKVLKVQPCVVRFLCKTQTIRAPEMKGYSQGWLIPKRAIDEFFSNYVRAAEIAKGLNTNTELLIKVLAAEGINPITGVGGDKRPQHFLRRADLSGVDLASLVAKGKMKRIHCTPGNIFTSTQVAELLGCDCWTVERLVSNGVLEPYKPRKGKKDVRSDSLFSGYAINRYLRLFGNRTDLVSAPAAAKMLNEELTWFHKRWVNSRLQPIEVKDGNSRYYHFLDTDVQELIQLKASTVSSPEAARLLHITQPRLAKLIRRGVLTPVSGPKIDGCGRNRYLRTRVENLINSQ